MEISKNDRGGKAREVGEKSGVPAEEGTKRISEKKMWPIVLIADEGSSKMRIRNWHWTWQCGRNHCLEIVSIEKPNLSGLKKKGSFVKGKRETGLWLKRDVGRGDG